MEQFINWLTSIDLTAGQIVCIVIFFVYVLFSAAVIAVVSLMGQGYTDLARGLRRILERQSADSGSVAELSEEIRKYYESYAKYNPSIHQHYPSIINWMDDILLQTNMFSGTHKRKKKRFGIWFDEYYDRLTAVQRYYEGLYPFYRCSSSQIQILEDISMLASGDPASVEGLVRKTEEEFVRLQHEGKKNERMNLISVIIGVAGILVSVLMTVLQML